MDENSGFYWDKVEKSIGKKGMGFVHDVYSSPVVLNKLQRYFVEETFGEDTYLSSQMAYAIV